MARPLFFDLDGTLTDPGEGITRCVEHALVAMGVQSPGRENLKACIGPPLQDSFAQLLGTEQPGEVDRAVAHYRERYVAKGMLENVKYEGVEELLDELKAGGHQLFVVTSKPHVYATQILEHFNLSAYFDGVFGPDMKGNLAGKVELIAHVLDQTGLSSHPPELGPIMLGDRKYDMLGAKANGLRAIGVTWGYGSREELLEAGADDLLSSPSQLPGLLSRLKAVRS